MSQLLSACSYSDDFEARKSRRSLFMPQTSELDGAPEPKRRRSADDAYSIRQDTDAGFSHSTTSPFKSLQEGKNVPSVSSPKQTSPTGKLNLASPEQKILLERQKQRQLLEEQEGFDSQDERWKRMERELDKAFPKGGPTRPMMVHQSSSPLPYDALVEQTSVAIQASLIDDLSPLKPLSYYRKVKSPWKNTESQQSSCTTSSPVPFQGGSVMNALSNPHAMSPVPILPATERPASVNNACPNSAYFLQIPVSAGGNGGSVVWATPTPPSGSSTPSPDQLIKMAASPVNAPLLYSPRSLTPTPEPVSLEPSVAGKQQAIITTPLVTVLEPQQVRPVQQTLSIQLPAIPQVGKAELHSVTPITGNITPLQFATPLVKLTDLKKVVSMETPTTTVQLLTDVSKRLSLPFSGEQSM